MNGRGPCQGPRQQQGLSPVCASPPISSLDTWMEGNRVLSQGTLRPEPCSICIEEWAKSGRKCPDRGRQSIKIPWAIPREGVYSS